MDIAPSVLRILERVEEDRRLTRADCSALLSHGEQSMEAGFIKAAADGFARRRVQNQAVLLGQIGIESSACRGQCRFCAFGTGSGSFQAGKMAPAAIVGHAQSFTASGDLFALFLMTMHEFDFAHLLRVIEDVRKTIPPQTRLVVNTGDFDGTQGEELRSAGVDGAYHIFRLREGIDTGLEPAVRLRTLEIIRKAGLNLYFCCEPVGPEHSPEELAEQIFIGVDRGCFQHGAMRRVPVPGTPLGSQKQITESRLAQIVAVAALATSSCSETEIIIVHEPSLLGLCAGANGVYAEAGANPRDTSAETRGNRGFDVGTCRKMLREAGFAGLRFGQSVLPL